MAYLLYCQKHFNVQRNLYHSNDASVMDEEGTVKQRRVVDSKDVSDYASHIEPDEVSSRSEDEIVYKQGVLQSTSGMTKISILPEVCLYVHFSINAFLNNTSICVVCKKGEGTSKSDVEPDSLEANTDTDRRKREESEDSSYDPSKKMNHLEAEGKFSLTLAGQERILRSARDAEDHLQLPEAVESSILAFINHSECMCMHMHVLSEHTHVVTVVV